MSVLTMERFGRFAGGAGLVGVLVLVGAVLVPPGNVFWTVALVAALVGSTVATAVLVRSRSVPTLAQVIATARAEHRSLPGRRGSTSEAGLRAKGELEP